MGWGPKPERVGSGARSNVINVAPAASKGAGPNQETEAPQLRINRIVKRLNTGLTDRANDSQPGLELPQQKQQGGGGRGEAREGPVPDPRLRDRRSPPVYTLR